MATNSTNDTNISQMERLTTCPVCLDKFRTPKLLPCMHTFCLTPCLTNLVDPRARSLRCPECRREHLIPAGGVQAFPMNLTMIGFLDLQPSVPSNQPDRCSLCHEQKQQNLTKCHDCSKMICGDCRDAHLRDATNHVHSLISQLRRTLPKLSEKIASYEQRVNLVRVHHEQIQREISSAVANLMEELKHREKALHTEAEVYMQSQLRTFRLQQEAAEVELASVVSFCESFETSFTNSSGSALNDVELVNMRQQCNRYTQQLATLQAQIPADIQKLRFVSDNQSTLSSTIQDFGRLIDVSRDQQQQTSAVSQPQIPVPSLTSNPMERRQPTSHYVSTIPSSMHNPTPSYQDYYQRLEDLYHGRQSVAPPASADDFTHRRRRNHFSSSVDNPFVDLSFTLPNRTTTSSYRGSWETQTPRRTTSSLFGPNPFTSSASTARSSDGERNAVNGSTRERSRPTETIATIEEQEPAAPIVERQRSNTFVLDEPSLPNLPQSGAQRPRDPVNVQELYNVRPRDRAQASVAFTIDLNEGSTGTETTTSTTPSATAATTTTTVQ